MSGIDTISITPDPEHLMGIDTRRKRHIQKHLEGQLRLRAVAVYSKWSDGGNHRVLKARKGGEH